MGQHVPATQWAEWIEQQRDSGLTVAEFCDVVGISTNSFYRWRRRLSAGREQDGTESTALNETFLPLHLIAPQRIEIELPCGAVMRVPSDRRILGDVVSALLQTPETSSC